LSSCRGGAGLQAAATGATAQCRLRSDGDPGRRAAATGAEDDARRGSGRETARTAVAMGDVDEDDGRIGCGGSERSLRTRCAE